MSEHEKAGIFDRLRKGLRESIACSKGELTLVTTELPVPPPKPGIPGKPYLFLGRSIRRG